MSRLILGDLIANGRIWAGAALVAAVAALVGAVAASDIQTAAQIGGTPALALYGISGTVLVFSAVTTVVVLGTVTNLAVALQQRSYALWQLIGLGPTAVRAVVHIQLAVMALLGGAIGCAAAVPLLAPLFSYTFADVPQLRDATPGFGPAAALSTIAYVLLTVTLGGVRGARRAARTPAIQALREPETAHRGMSTMRWIIGAVLALTLGSVVAGLPGKSPDEAGASLMLVGPLTAALLSALSPVFLTVLLRAWTAVVPATAASWWHLARQATAHQVSQSTAVVNPLLVAVALAGGLYASQGTASGGEQELSTGAVVLLLGGPLLLALTGATVTLFMAGRQRDREVALVTVAGATTATIIAAAAAEAAIYVGTACLLAVPTVIATALIGAWALGVPPVFGVSAVAVVVAAGLAMVLVAAVAPAMLASRKSVVRELAAQ